MLHGSPNVKNKKYKSYPENKAYNLYDHEFMSYRDIFHATNPIEVEEIIL